MLYLGIDVAKAKLDCCLQLSTAKYRNKVVANSAAGMSELFAWLERQQTCPAQVHAVLEATGIYHEQAALALHEAGVQVSVVNPAQARDFARAVAVRSKTDAIDSQVLARYAAMVQPRLWAPAPLHARQLQALLARREALAQDLQRERNRLEKTQAAQAACAQVSQSLTESLAFLKTQLNKIQQQIDGHIDAHPDLKRDSELLQSIPAVGPQVARAMLGTLHARAFDSAEQLAAYVGLVPVERQSGSSIHGKSRLSKAGPARIRAVLYMAAVVATRHNPHVKALYNRLLERGKTKMAALGAAMRKLVHLCFGVLKNQQPYDEKFTAHP